MLSEKVFKDGLAEIGANFDGLNLTKEKIKIWYKYAKDLDDETWQHKISNCIKGCHKTPTLADILDAKEYYEDTGYSPEIIERAKSCFKRNPGCYSGGEGAPLTCKYCHDYLRR